MQVDPSMVVRACIRLPVFLRIRLPVFSLPCLYQILYFGITHSPRCFSSFSYKVRTPILFMLCIYALSIHSFHLVSPFIYQPGFLHSCASSCLFIHVSAGLYSFMRCILPLLLCISQASFIHALHSASPCIYQPRGLEPL